AWPFLRSRLDLMEMVLAKADSRIAAHYDQVLASPDLQQLGTALRDRLSKTTAAVLRVTSREQVLADNPVLRRSIDVRNPYVDPINLVQVELLRRLRAMTGTAPASEVDAVHRALMVTINGIAAGMRNTG